MRTVSIASDLFDFSIHFISFLIFSYHPAVPTARHLQLPRCGGRIPCVLPLRTAPWPRTTSTSYEPNDHIIAEAYVEYTQESSSEQRFPDDFDYDDVTIGKTLLDACRRRADHSEEEGQTSCLSSSVSHDRTVRPIVCSFDSQVLSVQETQRHNSDNEQITTLLERQREEILAVCQAEIQKHEFQADYDRRSFQKMNETIESKKFIVLIKETKDADKINNFFMNSY